MECSSMYILSLAYETDILYANPSWVFETVLPVYQD